MQGTRLSKGQIAIVTGASRRIGIGTAICRAFARNGVDVFFTHWKPYDQTMDWGEEPDWPDTLAEELSRDNAVRVAHMEVNLADIDASTRIFWMPIMRSMSEGRGTTHRVLSQ